MRMVNLAAKILRLMTKHGLTQLELAERIGVSQPTVNRWTKGADVRTENLIALAAFAGQTVDDFLLSESIEPTISLEADLARLNRDLRDIRSFDPEWLRNFLDYTHKQAESVRARHESSE